MGSIKEKYAWEVRDESQYQIQVLPPKNLEYKMMIESQTAHYKESDYVSSQKKPGHSIESNPLVLKFLISVTFKQVLKLFDENQIKHNNHQITEREHEPINNKISACKNFEFLIAET